MKRLLTGTGYILVLLGFFLLKYFLSSPLYFDALILIFCVIGTYEMIRAFHDKMTTAEKVVVVFFTTALLLSFCLSDSIYRFLRVQNPAVVNYSPNIAFVVFMAALAVLFGLLVFRHKQTSLESLGYSLIAFFYPAVFLLVLMGCNHMPRYSEISLLFIFIVCPFADCFAYVFGKLLGKKLPMKMSPNVSPNKTMIGGFGSLIGGAIGAVAVFFAYYGIFHPADFSTQWEYLWQNLVFFIALGILMAAFAEFGDLVESAVKRKIGIKDMGKLLPGHGGILDRIDSSLYASLIVCFVMAIRIMTTG